MCIRDSDHKAQLPGATRRPDHRSPIANHRSPRSPVVTAKSDLQIPESPMMQIRAARSARHL
eukprot:12381946-Alexandrium_andersonii.AAC.1